MATLQTKNRRLTRKEVLSRINPTILKNYTIGNYTKLSKKIKIICKRTGLVFRMHLKSMYTSNGPNAQSAEDKDAYYKQRLIDNNINIIFENKINTSSELNSTFDKYGLEHKISVDALLQGNKLGFRSCIDKTALFKEKGNEIYNNKFDYSKVVYKTSKKHKVIIICPIHGEFKQYPNDHLRKRSKYGCRRCTSPDSTFTINGWITSAEKSNYFDSYKLYVIRCFNEEESMFKVGITFNTLDIRFKGDRLPYEYEIIDIKEGNPYYIYKLEKKIHRELKKFRYNPKIPFGGSSECFSNIDHYMINRYKK